MSDVRITIDAQIQVRRDTEANWRSVNPVLRDGEIAYSKDVNNFKIGDGASLWSDLDYIAIGGEGGGINEQELEKYLQDNGYLKDDALSGYAKTADVTTSIKEVNDSIKTLADLLASMWHLDENGNLVTDKQVLIKNNLIVEKDNSSGGEGADTPSGGGLDEASALSNYYTKGESDARYLAQSGGTIIGDTDALKIVRNTNGYSAITYYNTQNGVATLLGVMGFDSHGEPSAYRVSDNTWRTLIHSGNIGSYKAGDSALLNGESPAYYTPLFKSVATYLNSSHDLNDYTSGYYGYSNADDPANSYGTNTAVLALKSYREVDCWQLVFHGNGINNTNGPDIAIRANFSNQGWTAWHSIAYLDSNVASATKLTGTYHGSGDVPSNPYFWLNESGKTRYYLQAYNGNLCLGPTERSFIINSSGNVTIGGSDLAGNVRKLVVGGSSEIAVLTQHPSNLAEIDRNKAFSVTHSPSNDFGLHIWLNDDGTTNMQSAYASSYYGAFNLSLQPLGGNVGIGTTSPAYKLDVDGTGNFSVGVKANEVLLGSAGLYKGSYWSSSLSDNDMVISGGKISLTGAVTMSSDLSVAGRMAIGKNLGRFSLGRAELSLITETNTIGENVSDLIMGYNSSMKWSLSTRGDISTYGNMLGFYNYEKSAFAMVLDNSKVTINGNLIVSGDVASA